MKSEIESSLASKEGFLLRVKNLLLECRSEFKAGGIKSVFKKFGWKIFAIFFIYYLIRDLIIYLLIPYLVTKHFVS